MRAFRIPCFVLLILVVLSLANSAAVTRHCGQWLEELEAAQQSAAQEQWAEADEHLVRLRESWNACRIWLRVVLSHNTVEDVEEMLDRAQLMGSLQELTHMHEALAELRGLLQRIDEGERLSLANIL